MLLNFVYEIVFISLSVDVLKIPGKHVSLSHSNGYTAVSGNVRAF